MTPLEPRERSRVARDREQTSSTLRYSKSPARVPTASRPGFSDEKNPVDGRERESRVREVTTVIDRTPGRNELRTYIKHTHGNGITEKEERIYEPIRDEGLSRRPDVPVYRIERKIEEVADVRARDRTPPSYLRSQYEAKYSNNKIGSDYVTRPNYTETTRSPIGSRFERESTPTQLRSPVQRSTAQKHSYEVSPMRNFRETQYQNNDRRSRTPTRQSPSSYKIVREPSELEPRVYDHGNKDRVVYSPPNHTRHSARYADQIDGPYRREEIVPKSPQRFQVPEEVAEPFRERRYTKTDKYEDPSQGSNLKEEIITHHEIDNGNNVQINTYIRKIYSNEKNAPEEHSFSHAKPAFYAPKDFSGQKTDALRDSTDRDRRIEHQNLNVKSPRLMLENASTIDDTYRLSRPSNQGSNFVIESTKEYADLVIRESEKYKLRDHLALKLSKEDKFSSLSDDEKVELVGCLKAKIALFRELERTRVQLAESSDFNLADLFFLAKKTPRGALNESLGLNYEDFKSIYDDLEIRIDERFIRLIFVRNDYDNDGIINFYEFSELLAPFSSSLRDNLNRRPTKSLQSLSELPEATKMAIENVLRAAAEYEKETDLTREVTQHRLYSLYNLVDLSNKGVVVFQDLKDVMEQYGSFSDDQELIALIRRFDFNKDGKISLTEFIDQMSPLRNSQPYEHIRNKGY